MMRPLLTLLLLCAAFGACAQPPACAYHYVPWLPPSTCGVPITSGTAYGQVLGLCPDESMRMVKQYSTGGSDTLQMWVDSVLPFPSQQQQCPPLGIAVRYGICHTYQTNAPSWHP